MGLRGPAAKPTAQKIREGNPGKQKLNMNEPAFATVSTASEIKPSTKLSADEMKLWRAKVRAMGNALIRATDIPALTALVQCEARMFAITEKIAAIGPLVKTEDGGVKNNPLVRQLHEERHFALSMWGRFGHTPADRSRIMEESAIKADSKKSGILSGDWSKPKAAEKPAVEIETETVQ